jgi:hypothetical protein
MMKKMFLFLGLLLLAAISVSAQGNSITDTPKGGTVRIKITVGNTEVTALMADNAAARDFTSRLPLSVWMDDFANSEKIFYPEPGLTIKGVSGGHTTKTGDICVYVPWGDVFVYYGLGGGYSKDIILLGSLESGVEVFNVEGSLPFVKFEALR